MVLPLSVGAHISLGEPSRTRERQTSSVHRRDTRVGIADHENDVASGVAIDRDLRAQDGNAVLVLLVPLQSEPIARQRLGALEA